MDLLDRLLAPDPRLVERLAEKLPCHPIVAALLVNRGIRNAADAHRFLDDSFNDMTDPFELKGIGRAVIRIAQAIEGQETILVFGDYDVDGVAAACLLVEFLEQAGARVRHYIPNRLTEGYSIQPSHVNDSHIVSPDVRLIITADCGIGSHDAVIAANERGIDVIITDHHLVSGPLPGAHAVVNPNRPDCGSGLGHLAGVGVAFYLVMALRSHLRDSGHWERHEEPNLKRFCDLVALGTIADMVPLRAENRILVRVGIGVMNDMPRVGIRALITASGIRPGELTGEDISYRIAPRINAAGRMEHADIAFQLLRQRDADPAADLARRLVLLNSRRQGIEQEITGDILSRFDATPQWHDLPVLVLCDPSWHPGVLGIVASRLTRHLNRPVILLAESDGVARGSGRSIVGLDLAGCLHSCEDLLLGWGGHAQAVGLTMNASRLMDFQQQLSEAVRSCPSPIGPAPGTAVDAVLRAEDITPYLADAVERLMPFGTENPEPVFAMTRIAISDVVKLNGGHERFSVSQSGSPSPPLPAIRFKQPNQPALTAAPQWLIFHLKWNRWNGNQTLQLVVTALPEAG